MQGLTIVGGGLAGVEAAWQAASAGVSVKLYEMRPYRRTPAHHTADLAELVCSNSFRSNSLENAVGLLKEEMRTLNSLVMSVAQNHIVPAGGALAVNRNLFSQEITEICESHPLIEVIRQEVLQIPAKEECCIIATGPLTSDILSESIKDFTGDEHLYFFDAAAPVIISDSINFNNAFWSSRYKKGEDDYLNCPLSIEEYETFYTALIGGETKKPRTFEKEIFFEGCMPIESLAGRGYKTLLYGPMKPVGLIDPKTGERPFAVVQLRKEDKEGSLLNMVGFQTSLTWSEQRRIFSLIPALKKAAFARLGVMHRNTYICSPRLLKATYQLKNKENIFFAGQITGTEGYVESAASGLIAGINAARFLKGVTPLSFPLETMLGALSRYITAASPNNFQPMKANFGLVSPLSEHFKSKKQKKEELVNRSLRVLRDFKSVLRKK